MIFRKRDKQFQPDNQEEGYSQGGVDVAVVDDVGHEAQGINGNRQDLNGGDIVDYGLLGPPVADVGQVIPPIVPRAGRSVRPPRRLIKYSYTKETYNSLNTLLLTHY